MTGWKILSWNVNGIRTLVSPKVRLKKLLDDFDADIICFQETKISREALDEELALVPGYSAFFSFSRTRAGYSGVATYCRQGTANPVKAEDGVTGWRRAGDREKNKTNGESDGDVEEIGFLATVDEKDEEELGPVDLASLDAEGRCVVTQHRLECECGCDGTLFVFNVYVPRVDFEESPPTRLDYKLSFLRVLFRRAEKMIGAGHHVIITGDVNVCLSPDDHFDPCDRETFRNRVDRKLIAEYVETEFSPGPTILVDSFRKLHPARLKAYTCWNTQLALRAKNEGTRIDFVLVDRRLADGDGGGGLTHADVRQDVMGSDHCPVEARFGPGCRLAPSAVAPPSATRFYPEFSHKQQKLTAFFGNKSKGEAASRETRKTSSSSTAKTKTGPKLISHYFSKKKPKLVDDVVVVETEAACVDVDVFSADGESLIAACFAVEAGTEDTLPSVTSASQGSSSSSSSSSSVAAKDSWKQLFSGPPKCRHGFVCVRRTVRKQGPNFKREFWSCPIMPAEETEKGPKCQFFQWTR